MVSFLSGKLPEMAEDDLLDEQGKFSESQAYNKLLELAKSSTCPLSEQTERFLRMDGPLVELIRVARSTDGRRSLGKLGIVQSLIDLLRKFHETLQLNTSLNTLTDSRMNDSDVLLHVLQLTRNLCAGDSNNQDSFLDGGGVGVLASIVSTLLSGYWCTRQLRDFSGPSNSLPEKPMLERLRTSFGIIDLSLETAEQVVVSPSRLTDCLRALLQLLANFSRRGEAHQSAVWELFFPNLFLDMVALRKNNICGPLCMLLHTICQKNRMRSLQLCQGDGAVLTALIIVINLNESGDNNSAVEHYDWFELLLDHLCLQEPLFPLLFTNLGVPGLTRQVDIPNLDSDELLSVCQLSLETSSLTLMQANLLYTLCSVLSSQEASPPDLSVIDKIKLPMPLKSLCFIVDILRQAAKCVPCDSHHSSVPALTSASAGVQILGFSLLMLRSSFVSDTSCEVRTTVTEGFLSHGLMDLLLDLLQSLGPPAPSKGQTGELILEDRPLPKIGSFPQRSPYQGYRRDVVSVIANASHQNFLVQERIREKGGLLSVLQQCTVDVDNPFLREWSLWAMRNLLDGNEKNQQEVGSLEVKQAVNLPELQRMGLNVQIDPNTRRPRLYNDGSGPSQSS